MADNPEQQNALPEDVKSKFDLGRIADIVRGSMAEHLSEIAGATERVITNPTGAFQTETYKLNYKVNTIDKRTALIHEDTSYIRKVIDKFAKEKKNENGSWLNSIIAGLLALGYTAVHSPVIPRTPAKVTDDIASRTKIRLADEESIKASKARPKVPITKKIKSGYESTKTGIGKVTRTTTGLIGRGMAAADIGDEYRNLREQGEGPVQAGVESVAGGAAGVSLSGVGFGLGLKAPSIFKIPAALFLGAVGYMAGKNITEKLIRDQLNDFKKNHPEIVKFIEKGGEGIEHGMGVLDPSGNVPVVEALLPKFLSRLAGPLGFILPMVTPDDPGKKATKEEEYRKSSTEYKSGKSLKDYYENNPSLMYKGNEKSKTIILASVINPKNPNYGNLVSVDSPIIIMHGKQDNEKGYSCTFQTGPRVGKTESILISDLSKVIEIPTEQLPTYIREFEKAKSKLGQQSSKEVSSLLQKASFTIDEGSNNLIGSSGGDDLSMDGGKFLSSGIMTASLDSQGPSIFSMPGSSPMGTYGVPQYSDGSLPNGRGGRTRGSSGARRSVGGGRSIGKSEASSESNRPQKYGRGVGTPGKGRFTKGVAGDDYSAKAFNFFKSKGWSDAEAAAATGNLEHESAHWKVIDGWGDYDGKSYGIAQWRGDRYRALIKKYGNHPTFEQQLQFTYDEAKGSHNVGFDGTGKNTGQLSEKWRKVFEVSPAGSSDRISLSNDIYNRAQKDGGKLKPSGTSTKMTMEERYPKHNKKDTKLDKGDPRQFGGKNIPITANHPIWGMLNSDLASYKDEILKNGPTRVDTLLAADAVFRQGEKDGVPMRVASKGGTDPHSKNHLDPETGIGEAIDIKPKSVKVGDNWPPGLAEKYAKIAAAAGANRIGVPHDWHGLHIQNSGGQGTHRETMSWDYGAETDMTFRKNLQSGKFKTSKTQADIASLYEPGKKLPSSYELSKQSKKRFAELKKSRLTSIDPDKEDKNPDLYDNFTQIENPRSEVTPEDYISSPPKEDTPIATDFEERLQRLEKEKTTISTPTKEKDDSQEKLKETKPPISASQKNARLDAQQLPTQIVEGAPSMFFA